MANQPGKIRLPQIVTPWEPPANTNDESTRRYLTDTLRGLERDKLEGAQFSLSGTTEGDILVADGALVYRPRKTVPFSFGVGTHLSVTGNLIVTGNTSISGNLLTTGTAAVSGVVTCLSGLIVSGDPLASTTRPRVQIGNALSGGSSSGTGLGMNLGSGFTGDLVNLQSGGTKRFSVNKYGHLLIADDINVQAKIVFGGEDSSHPGLVSVGNKLQVYLGDFSDFTDVDARHILAHGTLTATGPVGQVGINARDTSNQAWAVYSQSGELNFFDSNGFLNRLTLQSGSGILALTITDAATSTVTAVATLAHRSSGTPAAGFGSELRFQLKSSTTDARDAGGLSYEWETATEGSQVSLGRLNAYYITTAREVMQWGTNSTVAMVGFLGAPKAVQQTGGAATAGALWTATEQTMLQVVYNMARTFGFLS